MSTLIGRRRIIALDIRPRSFGFAIFEGPNELLDFGAKSFRGGENTVQVPPREKLADLLDDFKPDAAVQADHASQRSNRTSIITNALEQELAKRQISAISIARVAVRKVFAGHDRNKHEIGSALAQQFPALASKLPPKRRCWESEDYRMSIFDAAALGVAYFSRGEPTS
jgi:hypothetical protein